MIDFNCLTSVFGKMQGRTKYLLGGKARTQDKPEDIKRIDCSGVVRYMLFHCTSVLWPDGSQNQLAWARKNLRKLAKYSDVQYAKDDPKRLFIAFLSPKPGKAWPRHVWLIHMGKTMESRSKAGVSSQSWQHYLPNCKEVFEIL